MSYSYSASFLALASSQWIGVPALMTAISEMARLDFSKASDRRGVRTMWNTATSQDQPVSLTKRFPENAAFVCLNDSDWANKRMQLEQALDYTEPTNQQNAAPANPNQPAVQQHNAQQTANNRSSFNDANTAFRNALRTMQDQVRTLDGVWDRGRFEGRFTWYEISRVDLNWQTVVQRVREILPITGVRVHAQAPSGDTWTAYADYIMLAQTLTTPPPLPQDGDFLYLWSHPRANGARTRLQLLRTGGNLTPLSWGPVAVAD